MFDWVEEFKKANDAYQLALQQESNAEFDYIEIAISNTLMLLRFVSIM